VNRRGFLKTAVCGAAGAALGLPLPTPAATAAAREIHWAWTRLPTDADESALRTQLAAFAAAGVSRLVLPPPSPAAARLARAEGLDLHAWFWTLCRGGEALLQDHPDWYVVSRDGKSAADQPPYVGYYHFLCPTREEVRAHLRAEVAATLQNDALAGLSLDYIRFPDVILPRALWAKYGLVQHEELPPYDFCYCKACRAAFRAESGIDPLELPDPPADEAWRRFRWNAVTRLVNELAEVVHGHGRTVTASVFPTPAVARRLVRQDWPAWNLDAVLPMVYHGFYEEPIGWIAHAVREGVAALPPGRPLYAGLYLPDLPDDAAFAEAVAAARAGGAQGVALFGGVRTVPGR
jgi:uncharacterized lipoprotein YddW (UPF0748 family)